MENGKDEGMDELAKALLLFFKEKGLHIDCGFKSLDGETLCAKELAEALRNIMPILVNEHLAVRAKPTTTVILPDA